MRAFDPILSFKAETDVRITVREEDTPVVDPPDVRLR